MYVDKYTASESFVSAGFLKPNILYTRFPTECTNECLLWDVLPLSHLMLPAALEAHILIVLLRENIPRRGCCMARLRFPSTAHRVAV